MKIILKGGAEVEVHNDDVIAKPAKCSRCGQEMVWSITSTGKKMPITKDKDGKWISHFADCPFANKFRKK